MYRYPSGGLVDQDEWDVAYQKAPIDSLAVYKVVRLTACYF